MFISTAIGATEGVGFGREDRALQCMYDILRQATAVGSFTGTAVTVACDAVLCI